jgi:hypothetical protein
VRDVQRIEQGMGRGVRDVNDHCAVLLTGAGMGMAVHDDAWLELFSPATRAQLQLSRDVAFQLCRARAWTASPPRCRSAWTATRSG